MSIKKVAERVGVSPSTVSRVLNNPNYRCAEPGMREKIWKAAIDMNYIPNEAARNLKLKGESKEEKTFYIHVLMTCIDSGRTDPFFNEILNVVETEIHKNICILSKVWHMPLFSNDRKCRSTDLDRVLDDMYRETNGRGDGLVVIGKCNREALRKLKLRYKGVVSINRDSTNDETDEVTCDGMKIAALAVEHLIELGHIHIGYVGDCHNETRYRGYLETLKKHGLEVDQDYVIATRQTEAEGYEAMESILRLETGPTGIYCANDITAIGMLKCLGKNKNRYYMPSIIASDDIEEAQYTRPMLTTVRLPKEDMGKFALYLLLDSMKNGHKDVVHIELEGRLMNRNSCNPVDESYWIDYYI